MSKSTGDGVQRNAGAWPIGFKVDRPLVLLILCAVAMPLALTRVGRLPASQLRLLSRGRHVEGGPTFGRR